MDCGVAPKAFLRIGLGNQYSAIVGSQDYLKACYQMDAVAISERIQKLLA
jgi:transketolase C-terminal domain/subunit